MKSAALTAELWPRERYYLYHRKMVKKSKVPLIVVTNDHRIVQFADKIDYLEDGVMVEKPAIGH